METAFRQKDMTKQTQGGWRTSSQGQRSCRLDRFEYGRTRCI